MTRQVIYAGDVMYGRELRTPDRVARSAIA